MTDAKRIDVHEALDEVKAQKERLEGEVRAKEDLYNNLRKTHNELVTKFQEAKLQSEKQVQELSAKSEELATLSQLNQDLKSSLHEKESSLRHLNSANEKLRFDSGERIKTLEGEKRELILSLDDSTATIQVLKSKICAANKETEDLQRIISLKDKKLQETAEKAQATKDLTRRDDVICKLEDEHRDLQDQLKWKNEQFQHLKEAHDRLQDNFRSSKAEWEREKSILLEEISSLQTSLDSQTRMSESLQTRLRICNQALAHEESTRKLLEVEISEYKLRFEDVFSECHEAKDKLEKLSLKRDEEVASLRDALASKDSVSKEMEYKMAHLEQENQDIRASLREFQEAQINSGGTTGLLKKLQKKLQSWDQLHQKSTADFKVKEIEWKSQIEKLTRDMDGYLSKLKVQNEHAQQLQEELESFHRLTEVRNEETSLVVLLLKSEFSVAYSQLLSTVSELELRNKKSEETILKLTEQLEAKVNTLHEVNVNLSNKSGEVTSLTERAESFEKMKQHQLFLEEELQRHKEMLIGSSENQLLLEEQVQKLGSGSAQKQEAKDDINALELVKSELAQKIVELEEAKSMAEDQNRHLEASLEACKEKNESLLRSVKEQDKRIGDLQQQLLLHEALVTERTEAIEALKKEKEEYFQIIEEKKSKIEDLVVVSKQEKKSLLQVIEERDQMIKDLEEQMKTLEQESTNASVSSTEKQIEIEVLRKALHETQNQTKSEVEEKDGKLAKMEVEVSDLLEKLKAKDESLFQSTQHAKKLEVLLERNKLETQKLMDQFGNKKTNLESLVGKLEVEKEALMEDIMNLSSDREDLLMQMEKVCENINEFSCKDAGLMGMLESMLQSSEAEKGVVNLPFSPSPKATVDDRSPLVDLNK